VDIFECVSWHIYIRGYTGLATTTVKGTAIVSINLIIEKEKQSNQNLNRHQIIEQKV
jgi:hypothetical protein